MHRNPGTKMLTYIDLDEIILLYFFVGNPALSVPCAFFKKTGLPIGLQIVGRQNADLSVLQMGFAFEQATKIGNQRPTELCEVSFSHRHFERSPSEAVPSFIHFERSPPERSGGRCEKPNRL